MADLNVFHSDLMIDYQHTYCDDVEFWMFVPKIQEAIELIGVATFMEENEDHDYKIIFPIKDTEDVRT